MMLPALGSLILATLTSWVIEEPAPQKIVEEVIVDASAQEVFRAWTTTEGLTSFFAPNVNVELRHGGPFEIFFYGDKPYGERGADGCRILSWIEDEMLSFTWNTPLQFEEERAVPTFVVVQLAEQEDGSTEVRLTHDGFGTGKRWSDVVAFFSRAWPHVLSNLEKSFEEGPLFESSTRMKVQRPELRPYVLYLRPTREDFFETGPTEEETRKIGEHRAYLTGLLSRARLIVAGPSFDPAIYPDSTSKCVALEMQALGICIFEAQNDEEARKIMGEDPAVQSGVFAARVHPMSIALSRG